MSNEPKTVEALRTQLLESLKPHQGDTKLMQRINAYVFNRTKQKLPAFMGSTEVKDDEKISVLEKLLSILKSGDYSELPDNPSGQAQTPPTPIEKPAPAAVETSADEAGVEDEDDTEVLELKLKIAKATAAKKKREEEAARTSQLPAAGVTEARVEEILEARIKALDVKALVDIRVAELAQTIIEALKK